MATLTKKPVAPPAMHTMHTNGDAVHADAAPAAPAAAATAPVNDIDGKVRQGRTECVCVRVCARGCGARVRDTGDGQNGGCAA